MDLDFPYDPRLCMTDNSTEPDRRLTRASADVQRWLRLPAQEAEDIVQDAWKEALEYGPDLWSLSEPGLRAYLKRCAVSAISRRARQTGDALRHVAARLAEEADAEAGEAGVPALARAGADPFARVASLDSKRAIDAALAQLGPDQRLRLTLSCIYDLPSEEVGRILGCSASSVDNSNARARARLRALLPSLGHMGGDDDLAAGTLWFEGGGRVELKVLRQETRALAAGASTFLTLQARDAATRAPRALDVSECWTIVHVGAAPRVTPPARALWSVSPGAGAITLQVPSFDGLGAGVKELFVFAGAFPG